MSEHELSEVSAAIAAIEERVLLRAQGKWSEHHNQLLTIGIDAEVALPAIAQGDAGKAMEDYYVLRSLMVMRGDPA